MGIETRAHAVHAGAEKFVEYVVFIGRDDQFVYRQPHHPRDVTGADVAEVTAWNREADFLGVFCRRLEITRKVIHHLSQ